jgi:hypothetical protein
MIKSNQNQRRSQCFKDYKTDPVSKVSFALSCADTERVDPQMYVTIA